VVAVKVYAVFFSAALSKRVVMVEGERGEHGNLPVNLNVKGGFQDRGLVLLRQVELAMLLKHK
jgi:hypothetical protein